MVSIETGQIVQVRSRQYLVEEVTKPVSQDGDTQVRLSCLEDDAQGQQLEVFWEREVDAQLVGVSSWEAVVNRGFDNPRYFSAYLHALRWNCVTSTNPKLFQAPYRAGIQVKAYQLEPLRKALLMPRVSLFIADDVGLGKTIEAGLILREMLMRQKIKRVVISSPPSVVRQWQEEMESRFGLIFQIFDRDFVASRRRERGYGINPWTTHTRFIISHALLRDEAYAAPLRDWLGSFSAGSMLILDEAHNAAPASSSKYAIDSQLTKTVRDIAPRFEHKLFLSATPHNGHSNSFAALLEILDPQRFCRGVPVKSKKLLDAVMVRRLKQDLREIGDRDFPQRQVLPVIVDNLPENAPELTLALLLQEYRILREERLRDAPKSTQTAANLVITSLQKRLLSSIEAFARTLRVHRNSITRQAQKHRTSNPKNLTLLKEAPGADDDRADISEAEVQAEEDAQMVVATQTDLLEITQQELELLEEMSEIAEVTRYQPDGRITKLVEWIKENLCSELGKPGATWTNQRVLIFTEYTDTKRYLEQQLQTAIANSDQENQRIDTFHGGMGEERRESIKAAFNANPSVHPLRILIATDAAREGVNLQNYCADLFHFDVPWNPSRMEQRNGRIDRKLQREATVRCYYFLLPQRSEDRVLDVLVKKTATIQAELGSLSPVVEKNISKLLDRGIRGSEEHRLTAAIETSDCADSESVGKGQVIKEELEAIRVRREKLHQQQVELEDMLRDSQRWLGLDDRHFRDTLSASLEILGAKPLEPLDPNEVVRDSERARWVLPALDQQVGADTTWANTLDSLRSVRKQGQKLWEWRKETTIRPVVFRDPGTLDGEVVHLHLEHRLVQRLLGRFLSQGFLYDELTRACVCLTDDPVPKVIALGRLSLYGERAARLHDEIIAVAAEWINPEARGRGRLRPLSEGEKENVLEVLEQSLVTPRLRDVPASVKERFQAYAPRDVEELIPHLERRAQVLTERANKKLQERGIKEAKEMKKLLEEQRDRILIQEKQYETYQLSLFNKDELRQIEADSRHWRIRLAELEEDIIKEPERIEQAYQVKADRVEPVGLVYLQPVSS
ncbi:MAG TPA: helicase [Cyanobacteria bacterium UBA11149]|nr:helicase [Cyanobacteria bacterium UBA11367]HBE56258.1 helicase [Cyanobacteria bacterium UBA11366]HBK64630.1 helicase [Cyanobacteria bacterium UBA11166]HBR76193.1 helicase [Cyanobacteria bacterium UBA11159]HBS68145.1 helicase [Cyanobacteria bacterium UBA11153]HBW91007.1 helicase [Cyanobacteria bacterium UBA11149]HCA95295.1 helicase [Cyanobacteria bacterium UBA9226]